MQRLIVLGAGKPHKGEQPSALQDLQVNKTILHWQMEAASLDGAEITFVGGYKLSEIKKNFSDIKIIENKRWESTGPVGSLLLSPLKNETSIIICYSDILFRKETLSKLSQKKADICIAFDSLQTQETVGQKEYNIYPLEKVSVDGEKVVGLGKNIPETCAVGKFIGLVIFNQEAISHLRALQKQNINKIENWQLIDLLEYMRLQGLKIAGVDVKGDWAELGAKNDISSFILGSKAETLHRLRNVVCLSHIEDQKNFTLLDWRRHREDLIKDIASYFGNEKLIIRSSALSEDTLSASNAGKYDSILNVSADENIATSIDRVFESYGESVQDIDQVLIQPMLKDVFISGVIFTKTLDGAAPWYVINYTVGDDTTAITSGISENHFTKIIRRNGANLKNLQSPFLELVNGVQEIEDLLDNDTLDIEFAISSNHKISILQVRPLVFEKSRDYKNEVREIDLMIEDAKDHFLKLSASMPQIPGNAKSMYGIMPDWNPAEIIGSSPSALSISMYQYLITDDVWAQQRSDYGYWDVRPSPLLVSFAGRPYVDVRASFSSFIPSSVPEKLAARLLEFYLERLHNEPQLHDKIEFSILPTCYTTNFSKWRKRLVENNRFTNEEVDELEAALRSITIQAVPRVSADLEQLSFLEERFNRACESRSITDLNLLHLLLHDCQRFGTLTFAHLARSGFVAVTMLEDAVESGILTENAKRSFMAKIKTVSHELKLAAEKVSLNEISWETFIGEFGHLRPGTYDITSARYCDNPEYYLRPLLVQDQDLTNVENITDDAWEIEKPAFFDAFNNLGFAFNFDEIELFLKRAIEGREYAKFIFTKSLSAALECVGRIGKSYNLSRDECSHLRIGDFLDLRNSSHDKKEIEKQLKEKSKLNQKLQRLSSACKLPVLITKIGDFDEFDVTADIPNFIGSKSIIAECLKFTSNFSVDIDLTGKIILIPQADPGYDWLFSKNIAGLITLYGGANSHMAIRSAEFGLPAAIGVGEQRYRKLLDAKVVELSPAQSLLKVIR